MKTIGRYNTECAYDLDHEITKEIDTLKKQISNVDINSDIFNQIAIYKAMKEQLEESIYLLYSCL